MIAAEVPMFELLDIISGFSEVPAAIRQVTEKSDKQVVARYRTMRETFGKKTQIMDIETFRRQDDSGLIFWCAVMASVTVACGKLISLSPKFGTTAFMISLLLSAVILFAGIFLQDSRSRKAYGAYLDTVTAGK
jgi:hypothetical protein